MCGRKGDWFAELDFDGGEATVMERGAKGESIGPVATVPLGEIVDGDEDHDQTLDAEDDRNKALCAIVFAPEAWRTLQRVRDTIAARKPMEREVDELYQYEREDDEMLSDIVHALECLIVPGRGD